MPSEQLGRSGVEALLLPILVGSALVLAVEMPGETQLHSMWQIEGSRESVVRFFGSLRIGYRSDTVTHIHGSADECGADSGGISPIAGFLRTAGIKSSIITVAVSSHERAAASGRRDGFDITGSTQTEGNSLWILNSVD